MELNGRFMCTYPEYKDGWDVTAKPDGTIIADGKEYSYLSGTLPLTQSGTFPQALW